jgi:hypothetical protein
MGRFIDLCAEVASEADEGEEGLILSPDAWDRFREDFNDEDIEDALKIVQENLVQEELVNAADSMSAYMVDVLGVYGSEKGFAEAVKDGAVLTLGEIAGLVRRTSRLEDILTGYREGSPLDRSGLDALARRLLDRDAEVGGGYDDGHGNRDEVVSDVDADDSGYAGRARSRMKHNFDEP